MKKALLLLLLSLLTLSIPAGFKRLTYGFKIAKLHLELPSSSEWESVSSLSQEELGSILSQPFRFLGKGAQCYAFSSRDEQYVLKLFRFDQRKGSIRGSSRKKSFDARNRQFLSACKLAYEEAREETGLMHLHLNLTSGTLPILKARSPIGGSICLPLDGYRFALQKKAVVLEEALFNAHSNGKLTERIDAIVDLLERRTEKGIGNRDPSLWRNFGFLGEQALEIDFGNYVRRPDFSEPEMRRKELERYTVPLRDWLKKHAPESVAYFDERMRGSVRGGEVLLIELKQPQRTRP